LPFYLIEEQRIRAKAIIEAPTYIKAVELLNWHIEYCTLIGIDNEGEERLIELLKRRFKP